MLASTATSSTLFTPAELSVSELSISRGIEYEEKKTPTHETATAKIAQEGLVESVKRPILFSSGIFAKVTLRKVTPPEAPRPTSIATPTTIELAASNRVTLTEANLCFELSEYPVSKWGYWRNIVLLGFGLGVQLEQEGCDYHQHSVGASYEVQEGIRISLIASEAIDSYLTHRTYEIAEKGAEIRTFHHFSLVWPDLSIPKKASFLTLAKNLQTHGLQEKLTHIHCRAGRGRTGTLAFFLAATYLPEVDPKSLLERMRSQRAGLVETEAQERFALDCAKKLSEEGVS